jgi:flavin-dependent dehydrogenase
MPEHYDAAVVGGGPAGATAARCLARRGWKVCLFEPSRFSVARCGETLPPEINPLLRRLDLFDEFLALRPMPSPGIVSHWGGVPSQQDFLLNPHGTGWHIDRAGFDRMLCRQAAAAGAIWIPNRAQVSARDRGLWRISGIEAKVLVDASGRNGLRIEGHLERDFEDRLLAIVLQGTSSKGAAPDRRTVIESAPDGWWYSALLPSDRMVAMFFTGCDVYTRRGIVLAEQLVSAALTRKRLAESAISGSHTVHVTSSCRKIIAGEAWLAAGDSACSYDPLSGRGIFSALRQGDHAAVAVDAYLRGDTAPVARYAALVRSEFTAYVAQRRDYYAQETRWAGSEFWAARTALPGERPDPLDRLA